MCIQKKLADTIKSHSPDTLFLHYRWKKKAQINNASLTLWIIRLSEKEYLISLRQYLRIHFHRRDAQRASDRQLASADWLWDIFPHVELYQILHWKTSIFSQARKTILSALNIKINGLWKNQYSCESMHSVSIQIMTRNGPKCFE